MMIQTESVSAGVFAQVIVNSLITGAQYTLIALGFGLIYSTVRFLPFAHGSVYAIGAYLGYVFVVWLHLPVAASLCAAAVGTGAFGSLAELGIHRPLRKRGASNVVHLLASLGVLVATENVLSLLFGSGTRSVPCGVGHVLTLLIGIRITPIQILTIVAAGSLVVAVSVFIKGTRLGKQMLAVASDPDLSRSVGIDYDGVLLLTFFLGSAIAGIAAVLASLDSFLNPTMGLQALLMGIVAAIVGGVGSVRGSVLGGLLISFIQHLTAWQLTTRWQDAAVFSVLIIFLVARPQGFLGKSSRNTSV